VAHKKKGKGKAGRKRAKKTVVVVRAPKRTKKVAPKRARRPAPQPDTAYAGGPFVAPSTGSSGVGGIF